ncbi:MAG TPA: GntR family transcriptional regulator [Bacilli bacterium]
MNTINKLSPVPLYHQIKKELEKKIKEGQFNDNPNFLSEQEICEMYSVSRTTVRQALRKMIEEGLLYKNDLRGRLRVAAPKVNQNLTRLYGFFTEDVLNSGMKPHTKLLSLEEVHDPHILSLLGLQENETAYLISRLHEGSDEPLAIQNSYIAEKVLPNIKELDLTKSIFKYITKYSAVRGTQIISMRFPTSRERTLLRLNNKVSVFQINRTSYAEDGTVIEYFECVLSGDRYNFTIDWTS